MPGIGDGSSQQNAKDWDHSFYIGGTRVYDSFTHYYSGPGHWWAVELKEGIEYTIQTRLPTPFSTYLYLYHPDGYQLAFGGYSGDDGSQFAKIVYTPTMDGLYAIFVRGRGYYDTGQYTLESIPAPFSGAFVHVNGSRFSSIQVSRAVNYSRFDVVRDPTVFAEESSRFDARALSQLKNQSEFDARAMLAAKWLSRFKSIRILSEASVYSRFDVRSETNRFHNSDFDSRAIQESRTLSIYKVYELITSRLASRFGSHALIQTRQMARANSFVKPGWSIFVRDTGTSEEAFLGFIDEDANPKELLDVPLSDGVYEIEVRPHQYFWENCRGRKITTLVVGSGSIGSTGLPVIQDLTQEIVSFASRIKWKITEEYAPGAFQFGLWFSPSTPVDTSGPPDQIVGYSSGIGEYQYTHNQTTSEYVAVAAFTATETGPVSELYLPWSNVVPRSPDDQFAYRSVESS
jgi:hypothetical protein